MSARYSVPRIKTAVVDEMRAAFLRTAERGAVRITPQRLRREAAARGRVVREAAPPIAPPPQRQVAAPPPPTPITPPRRRVAMGDLEDNVYPYQAPMTVQLGNAIQPTMKARLLPYITQRKVMLPGVAMQPRIGVAPVGGYPVVREEEEADWTTYAMVGGVIVAAGVGVWWLKKKKKI